MIIRFILSLLLSGITFILTAQEKTNPAIQSEELGKVSWNRDYETALSLAAKENKPILILFQEVPGCSTCRNYGNNVLSHPLMVEAIEDQFIPLAIFNNKKGKDKEVLDKYKEPSWNNPVVRIVSSAGWDLAPRVAGDYSAVGIYKAMEKVLNSRNTKIPEYMRLLKAELFAGSSNQIKEKYFKMYCFWSGEKHLGKSDAIISAQAGFMNGYEVVKVKYDAGKIKESQLEKYAVQAQISPINDNGKYRFSEKDHLFYLRKSAYQYIPLTTLQKTRINSSLGSGKDATVFLSPKQKGWLKQAQNSAKNKQILLDQDIISAWNWK